MLPRDQEGVEEWFPMVDFARAREELTVCDPLGKACEKGEALRMLARNVLGLTLLACPVCNLSPGSCIAGH